ncbi:MAG TPA: response regulator [Candidatus Saccharimonadales bacterium]|nr:response regulator [Candidatus Saccharimonadales bacterium]
MAGLHKILIVEDVEELRNLYKTFLEMHGFEVQTASDGQKGIDAAREFQPDLIFLDVMMPNMDGFMALKILRHDASYNCTQKKIVILTNLGDTERISQEVKRDMDGYVIKAEIVLEDLLTIIQSFEDK